MNFAEEFHNCVKTNRMINVEATPSVLIPNLYHPVSALSDATGLLTLLGGGNVHVEFPVSFSFQSMDCCLLLHTQNGGGRIFGNGRSCSVTEDCMTFIDCSQPFSLQSLVVPWNFRLFFLKGSDLPLYKNILSPSVFPVFHIPECSMTAQNLQYLLSVHESMELSDLLRSHRLLTDIFCSLCESLTESCSKPDVPSYLLNMYDMFEHHYNESLSLADMENRYNISRYRLCREFTAAFGISPIQYLIQKRMSEAKKMLRTTDWTVQEISSKVGYDNVNHFIHLFKKETGYTPNVYRKSAAVSKPSYRHNETR